MFDVKGHDLYIKRSIKLTEAFLGVTLAIPTIDGKELSLKIPAGVKHKTQMRLSGNGLPFMNEEIQGGSVCADRCPDAETFDQGTKKTD